LIDFIKAAKNGMYALSSIQIGGYQIDTGLHLVVGFGLVVILSRSLSLKMSVSATLGLILFKELFDLFAKPHRYRMRPLEMDLLYDVTSGLLGVFLAYWLLKRWEGRDPESPPSR
jgi:hypothetical protein